MNRYMGGLEIVEPEWPAPKNVQALTTTRIGGVSKASYTSLNLGAHVSDDPAAVAENRHRLAATLGLPTEPVWLEQIHGREIVNLAASPTNMLVADGAMTARTGLVCCIMTADCLPLFLCDHGGTQVAVIHVGWRGLAAGIVEHAISLFNAPARQLLAWAGPAISVEHFEVGAEVKAQLGGGEQAWRESEQAGKYFANLYNLVGERAAGQGIGWYGHTEACTFADKKRFFSHRRDGLSGRLASIIYKS